jgi:hypothetical protein
VSINLRRVPHPYTADDAISFVTTIAATIDTVFLVEHERAAIGLVGVSWEKRKRAGTRLLFRCRSLGQGLRDRGRARAVIDYAFEEFAIDETAVRSAGAEPGVASRAGEVRISSGPASNCIASLALGSSTPVDRFKLERSVWASLRSWSNSTRR